MHKNTNDPVDILYTHITTDNDIIKTNCTVITAEKSMSGPQAAPRKSGPILKL